MAAHQYWRLLVTGVAGGSQVAIGELEFATEPSGSSVATGGIATASSFSTTYTADLAFNGSVTGADCWRSATVTYFNGYLGVTLGCEWIQYDFGAGNAKDIAEMRISFPNIAATIPLNNSPSMFTLYWSDDGLTWVRHASWGGVVFALGETKTFNVSGFTEGPKRGIHDFRYRIVKAPNSNSKFNQRLLFDKRNAHRLAANHNQTINGNITRYTHLFDSRNGYIKPLSMNPLTGVGRIAGTTLNLGMPAARRVILIHQKSGLLIDSKYTAADGAFEFKNLQVADYIVIGLDAQGVEQGLIYTSVKPATT